MYKTETHAHVSEVSFCSQIPGAEMARLYAAAGYHTLFISDHFSENYFNHHRELTWPEKIHSFFSGYRSAREAGEKLGLTVLPAAEISFKNNPNHYLVYGLTEEFLCAHPSILDYTVEEFHGIAKENGLLLVQAHPYRDNPHNYTTPHAVDGIEIYNGNPGHDDHSDLAKKLADDNGLLSTSGSDSHLYCDIGAAGVLSDEPIETAEDFIALIRGRKQQIIR
ncbi:MAG: hypothetical protein E7632_09635 [Ruminococcaceae bacterium]|nr:hypothetical protein [Oscillospiraceae bacterium]